MEPTTTVETLLPRQNPLPPAALGFNTGAFAYGGIYSLWVIVYIFLIMWLISWFCEFIYKMFTAARRPTQGAEKPSELRASWAERFANAVRLLRDAFFLLLGCILINQSSYGITRSVLAITWTLFGLFVLWAFVKLFTTSGLVDFVMWWPVAGLLIANFALAWNASANWPPA